MRHAPPLLLALLVALGTGTASAQELERLFLTPEQRAALDARRKARVPDKPAAAATVSPITRFQGHVVRSSGRNTLWVDGQVVREGEQPGSVQLSDVRDKPGAVTLSIGEAGQPIELRVGESVTRDSGEVRGLVGSGQVGVGQASKPR